MRAPAYEYEWEVSNRRVNDRMRHRPRSLLS